MQSAATPGIHNRPAGGERIRSGTGGRGDDQPVRLKGADELLIHVRLQVDHAGDLGLSDDDVVQRLVRLERLAAAHQFPVQHFARHHALLAAKGPLQLRIKLIQRDGGQESQAAQIHRKDRNHAAGHGARRRQQRAVASQHDHQLRAFRHFVAGSPSARPK